MRVSTNFDFEGVGKVERWRLVEVREVADVGDLQGGYRNL